MRIDLPQCDFSDCRRRFDGNCNSKEAYRYCKYRQMRDNDLKIQLVSSESGDWHGLYVNETLVYEGHDIPVNKVVSGINHFRSLDYTETSVSDETMEQGLPSFMEYPFE